MTTFISGNYTWTATTPSAAQFGVWLTSVRDAFLAVGMEQTADTGQYDPGVTTWPAGGGFEAGYWMFRFTDTLQATAPVYIKIRLGRGGNYIHQKAYQISFGSGTDGAGTLTGVVSTVQNVSEAGGLGTQTTLQNYAMFSAADGICFIGIGATTANAFGPWEFAFSLERFRDASGNITGDGLNTMYTNSGNLNDPLWRMQSLRFVAPTFVGTDHNSYCIAPGLPANAIGSNGDKLLYPHFYETPNIRQRRSSFTVKAADFGSNPTTFSATPIVSEGSRTYIHFGSALKPMISILGDVPGWAPVFLWE